MEILKQDYSYMPSNEQDQIGGKSTKKKGSKKTSKKRDLSRQEGVKGIDVNDINNNIDIDSIYKFIDLFFKQKNIMYTHLYNSYDKLLDEDIPNFLKTTNNTFFEKITKDKVYKYKFEYNDISIKPPFIDMDDEIMFPHHARLRNLTYASKLVATITQVQEIIDIATDKITRKIVGQQEYDYPIANIPILLRSKYCSLNLKKGYDKSECEYDPGGYFIVNGSEKVVLSIEKMIENRPLVFTKKEANVINYKVQVNSKSFKTDMTQIIDIRLKKDLTMSIRVQILNEIPVFILMRALGIESDRDIIKYCVYDENDIDMINIIRISLENSKPEKENIKIITQNDALNYLITKMKVIKKYSETDKDVKQQEKKMHLLQQLKDNFLPHVTGTLQEKAYYLGYMINRLLQCYLGRIKSDDRDSYINKRIDLPGQLVLELFKQFYKKMMNECTKFFKKRNPDDDNPLNIINQIKPNIIEQGLKTALLTGAWGKRKGIAQMLARLTYLQTIASLRRVISPTVDASTNKMTSPRHLHPSIIGPLCVTGDTEVLLDDGITTKKISDMTNNDCVMTFNKRDLTLEPSEIYDFFSKMPDRLLKITTITGNTIKCTPEHKLLKFTITRRYMLEAEKLKVGDMLILKDFKKCMLNDLSLTKYHLYEDIFTIPIKSIEEIEPELVYDFTTVVDNHSFIANSVISSNCFIETSEGPKVGLVKNLSLIGNVTVVKNSQLDLLRGILRPKVINLLDIPLDQLKDYTRVLLNGEIIGFIKNPRELYNELKLMKYNGSIDRLTGIAHDIRSEIECKDLRINCDTGRMYHPVLRVDDNNLLLSKKMIDLISLDDKETATKIISMNEFMMKFPGVVEYIDTDEKFNAMIAMFPSEIEEMRRRMVDSMEWVNKMKEDELTNIVNRYDQFTYVKYTHCEIHPSLLIGVVVANIPFPQCNQGPRNIYQYSQARQAMGIYATNWRDRVDISYILYHPQRPIVTTRLMKYVNTEQLPAGENCIVAIACFTGSMC